MRPGDATPGAHPPGSLRHIVRQSGAAGTAQLVGVSLRFGTAVLVARLLGPSALGLYVLALTVASGAALMSTAGLDRASTRFVSDHRGRDERGEAFGMFLFSSFVSGSAGVILGALLAATGDEIAVWLHRPELVAPARVMAFAVPLLALGQVSRAALCGFQDVRLAVVLEQVATPVATSLLLVGLHLWRPADAMAGVVAAAVALGMVGLVSWVAAWIRFSDEPATPVFRPPDWLRFSVPAWLEQWMFFVVGAAGYALLARFDDMQAVGVYASAMRVAALVGLPLLAVGSILGPTISNMAARGEWERLGEMYTRVTRALAVIGILVALLAGVGGKWLLGSFGPGFSAASGTLVILLVGHVVNSVTGPSGLMLTMTGRIRLRLANATVAAVVAVGLGWVLVPRWGAAGAATAGVVASSIVNAIQVVQVRHLFGMWAYGRRGPDPTNTTALGSRL